MKPWKTIIILFIAAITFVLVVQLIYSSLVGAGEPLQHWIYVAISPTKKGVEPAIVVMTNNGGVVVNENIMLDSLTYNFGFMSFEERQHFDLLKNCFNMKTITPGQLEEFFGSRAVITYAYAYLVSGPKIHTVQEFMMAYGEGRVKQNSVTIRLTD